MHTPGPWYVEHPNENIIRSLSAKLVEGDDGMVAATYRMNVNQRGNTHLIAAAPDLLKVAEDMVSLLCTCDCNDWATLEEQDAHCHCDDRYGYLKNARAAIRKTVVK